MAKKKPQKASNDHRARKRIQDIHGNINKDSNAARKQQKRKK